jgi:hypothetical protein
MNFEKYRSKFSPKNDEMTLIKKFSFSPMGIGELGNFPLILPHPAYGPATLSLPIKKYRNFVVNYFGVLSSLKISLKSAIKIRFLKI